MFKREEVRLSERNDGFLLEQLAWEDEEVESHYTLSHFDVPRLDEEVHELQVGDTRFSMQRLKQLEPVEVPVLLECAGNGRSMLRENWARSQPWSLGGFGMSRWKGARLSAVLQEASVQKCSHLLFIGADVGRQSGVVEEYMRELSWEEAQKPAVLLAWERNGHALERKHGFPLRLVVPSHYGMASVKWLKEIRPLSAPCYPLQNKIYTYRVEGKVRPVGLKQVRSLMAPPGIPDFYSRQRVVEKSRTVQIRGKAWSSCAIVRVEFSENGGADWKDAELLDKKGAQVTAWTSWRCDWKVPDRPSTAMLMCRATDERGSRQPLTHEEARNDGGYAINGCQRLCVQII